MSARRKTRRRFVAANGCSKSSEGGVTCSDLLVESIHEEKTPEEFNEQTKHSEVGESEARATCCTGSQSTTDWQCLSRQRLSLASAQSHSAVWRRSCAGASLLIQPQCISMGTIPIEKPRYIPFSNSEGRVAVLVQCSMCIFNGDRE